MYANAYGYSVTTEWWERHGCGHVGRKLTHPGPGPCATMLPRSSVFLPQGVLQAALRNLLKE